VAARKPFNPPKFVALGAPGYRGDYPRIIASGQTDKPVMQDGAQELKRHRGDETVYLYQLVKVCKPKPVEFVIETFAVCEAPKQKGE
jgi:hypothetical protein